MYARLLVVRGVGMWECKDVGRDVKSRSMTRTLFSVAAIQVSIFVCRCFWVNTIGTRASCNLKFIASFGKLGSKGK